MADENKENGARARTKEENGSGMNQKKKERN